jgi:hypothetical protein
MGVLLIILMVVCVSASSVLFLLLSRTDTTDPVEVAGAFAAAMRTNNTARAKDLAASHLRPVIDSWVSSHTPPPQCPFSLDFDHPVSSGVTGYGEGKATVSYSQFCEPHNGYEFIMHDIILEEAGGEWNITGWGTVCESFDSSCLQSSP